MIFEYPIRMRHTDTAGVMFFARKLEFAHDAYEAFLEAVGIPLPPDMLTLPVILPIVHVEADYKAPLRLNDRVCIDVRVESVGSRSFTIAYEFRTPEGDDLGPAKSVHVAMERESGRSVQLPPRWRDRLLEHQSN